MTDVWNSLQPFIEATAVTSRCHTPYAPSLFPSNRSPNHFFFHFNRTKLISLHFICSPAKHCTLLPALKLFDLLKCTSNLYLVFILFCKLWCFLLFFVFLPLWPKKKRWNNKYFSWLNSSIQQNWESCAICGDCSNGTSRFSCRLASRKDNTECLAASLWLLNPIRFVIFQSISKLHWNIESYNSQIRFLRSWNDLVCARRFFLLQLALLELIELRQKRGVYINKTSNAFDLPAFFWISPVLSGT